MSRPAQLALPLAHRPAQGLADFLTSPSNEAAFAAVVGPTGLGPRLAISGPAGSGKSHLASIWGERTAAVTLPAADVSESRMPQLLGAPAIVFEDADNIANLPPPARRQVEALLFHLLNVAKAEDGQILLIGRQPPSRWEIDTPDLASRLAALPHQAIQPPDDALLSSIVRKLFHDRQLTPDDDVIEYLLVRMERSFAAAEELVNKLDSFGLAKRRRITKRLAGEYFEAGDREAPAGKGRD